MPLQSLIFTALPNGLTPDGNSLRISVLMSPRLEPQSAEQKLRSFPDFVSWPKTLAGAQFTAHLGGTAVPMAAVNVDTTIGVPDDATWAALFPADTYVRPFKMRDHSDDIVVSYDTVALNDLVKGIYADFTVDASDELPAAALLGSDKGLTNLTSQVDRIDRKFFNEGKNLRDVSGMFEHYGHNEFSDLDTPDSPLAAFQLFHTPPSEPVIQTVTPDDDRLAVSWQTHKRAKFDADKAVSNLDFHQIAAAMNQYPTMLRRLGLVLDFTIPRRGLPEGNNLLLSVSVRILTASGGGFEDVSRVVTRRTASLNTHVQHSSSVFEAIPRPGQSETDYRVKNGLLDLNAGHFALLQADVDGAGHKLLNFARTLLGHARGAVQAVDPVSKMPRRSGAPALRNAGLMLVHRRRGKALTAAFKRNKTLDDSVQQMFSAANAPTAGVYAEDLVRGWRVDIWDKLSGKWRSLCERLASYDVAKGTVRLSNIAEEGVVRLAATGSADSSNANVTYLHEAVAVWNGWSLVAQQPGKSVAPNEKVSDSESVVPDGVRLRTTFVAKPGSLPRLRYGHEYAVRARVVDLAGNSLAPSTSGYKGDQASIDAAAPYLRFEPVQPPGFALVASRNAVELPREGESMARVAIRSFNNQFDDPAPSAQIARRWAVAPRTSQREAELHGALDGAKWSTPQQYAMLAARDNELAHTDVKPANDAHITVPSIGSKPQFPDAKPGIGGANVRTVPKSAPNPATYAILDESATLLPYLPDPLCTHVIVRIRNHPLSAPEAITIPLYPDPRRWPDAAPIPVRVYEANDEIPRYDEDSATLLLPTPKGVRATVRFASMLKPDTLKLMGVWNWIPEDLRTAALRRRAETGGLWPLTPWRELDVVHAVQRPLLLPEILSMDVHKPAGATFVVPTVFARCHRNSTDRYDLRASWHDPRDSAFATSPVDLAKDDVPFSIRITDPQGYAGIVEHLVDERDTNVIMFGDLKPKANDDARLSKPKVHEFGDTRYRRVEYRLAGTTRFREYMPPNVLLEGKVPSQHTTEANITLEGPVSREWVMNSGVPAAPEVLYVVPTFGWTRGVDNEGKQKSWRRGSGLRVWLDRPWNTTGYGEMLAVVFPPAGVVVEPNDAKYKSVATQWGNDPIWKSSFVEGATPTLNRFTLARTKPDATGSWLPPGAPLTEADQPPEQAGQTFVTQQLWYPGLSPFSDGRVDVAPHDVFWDAERRLWYCDIEISHGAAYFPFVRLALARYQPSSMANCHLSSVVMADFASLAPDRWLTVTRTNATHRHVGVFGFSPDESSGHVEAWPRRTQTVVNGKIVDHVPADISKANVVEVWVEKLTQSQGEDFGWHKVTDGVESPVFSRASTDTVATRDQLTKRTLELTKKRDFEAVVMQPELEASFQWPTLWNGTVTLPAAPGSDARYRLVVAEYEEYLADDANVYDSKLEKKGRRLVYVEHTELT